MKLNLCFARIYGRQRLGTIVDLRDNTTAGLDRRRLRIGQRYRIGGTLVELTKVRAPCATLNVYGPGIQKAVYDAQVKAGDPSSPRWGLSGFYTSVLRPGSVRPGDPIMLLEEMT